MEKKWVDETTAHNAGAMEPKWVDEKRAASKETVAEPPRVYGLEPAGRAPEEPKGNSRPTRMGMWAVMDGGEERVIALSPNIVDRLSLKRARPRLSKTRIAFIMSGFGMGGLLTGLDGTMVSTALPDIQKELSLTQTQYSWVGSAYMFAGASLLCLWGPLSDIVGRRWVLTGGLAVFMAGNLVAALAHDSSMLIAARAVQGVGAFAFIIVLNVALADMFRLKERGLYIAVYSLSTAIGASMGPIFSGLLIQHLGWRYCFWIMVPCAAISLVLTAASVPASLPRQRLPAAILRSLDYGGALLVTCGTLSLLVGLQFGGIQAPWHSAQVLSLLLGGAALLGVFVWVESSAASKPLMPLVLFLDRSRAACFVIDFAHGFVYIGCIWYLPLYFQLILDASAAQAGLWLLVTALPCGVIAAAVGWSVKKTGRYRAAMVASTASLTAAAGCFISFSAERQWGRIIGFQLLLSIGVGSLYQVPCLVMQAAVPPSQITAANTVYMYIRNISSAVSIVVGQVLLQSELKRQAGALLAAHVPPALVNALPLHMDVVRTMAPDLTAAQEQLVKQVLTTALSRNWALYTGVSGIGLLASLLLRHEDLS